METTTEALAATQSGADQLLDALRAYTQASAAVEAFAIEHVDTIITLNALKAEAEHYEGKVKELARQHGPCSNAEYTVSVQRKMRRWYDTDRVLELAPFVKAIPGVIIESVDRAKVESLIKGGFVPASVVAEALHEEPMTPAVTIKRNPLLEVSGPATTGPGTTE